MPRCPSAGQYCKALWIKKRFINAVRLPSIHFEPLGRPPVLNVSTAPCPCYCGTRTSGLGSLKLYVIRVNVEAQWTHVFTEARYRLTRNQNHFPSPPSFRFWSLLSTAQSCRYFHILVLLPRSNLVCSLFLLKIVAMTALSTSRNLYDHRIMMVKKKMYTIKKVKWNCLRWDFRWWSEVCVLRLKE